MKVYCIYDKVAKEAGPLFTAKNDDVAVRMFNQVLSSNHVENQSDYILQNLGEYEPEQPTLFGYKVPTLINTSEEDDE